MNCYVCVRNDVTSAAVATCLKCGVGLCVEHLAEAPTMWVA